MSRAVSSLVLAGVLAACGGARPVPAAPSPAPAEKKTTVFKAPADTHEPDASLSPGTVTIDLRDATGAPAPHETVFLAQISDHPAPDVMGTTDARGHATLDAPSWVGGSARAICSKDGAIFMTEPFEVPAAGGVRVVLHAYRSSRELRDAMVVFEMNALVEPHGTGARVTILLRALDVSAIAWKPDLTFALPPGATNFDSGIVSPASSLELQTKNGEVRLYGTVAPGSHAVEMRFDVPTTSFRLATPPHLVRARVVAWAGPATKLEVAGYPPAAVDRTMLGAPAWVATRDALRGPAPPASIDVTASGLVEKNAKE